MTRVGILAADLTHFSGWAHYSLSMVEALGRANVPMTILTARNTPDPPRVGGGDVLPILPTVDPLDRGMLVRLALAYPFARRRLAQCDVIHSLIEPYAPLAALIAGKRPLVVTGHGSYVHAAQNRSVPIRALYRRAFQRATVACVSHYTARVIQTAIPGVRTVVIPNGIDFDRYGAIEHAGAEVPAEFPTVLSVGAIKARKGTVELVQAMAQVRERIPTVQCMIVGSLDVEPETVARARAAISELNLGEHVHLLGRIPDADLLRLYAAADVFALPSINVDWKFEGYGLALIEASAAGLPVIGSRDCGAEDVVQDGVTGLLIPQGAEMETSLAAAITRLLTDRALAARMGSAGRVWAQTQTWDRAAAQLIALYEQTKR